jgi:sugar/nucleoside kinase (ribokinase family)
VKKIHCLGIIVMDALSGPLEQYPVARLNPCVITEQIRFMPGGGAVNTACALARMGCRRRCSPRWATTPRACP